MNIIKLILKGVLLYSTILLGIFFICGIDSIYENNLLEFIFIILLGLGYINYKVLTEEDVNILTFNKWLE